MNKDHIVTSDILEIIKSIKLDMIRKLVIVETAEEALPILLETLRDYGSGNCIYILEHLLTLPVSPALSMECQIAMNNFVVQVKIEQEAKLQETVQSQAASATLDAPGSTKVIRQALIKPGNRETKDPTICELFIPQFPENTNNVTVTTVIAPQHNEEPGDLLVPSSTIATNHSSRQSRQNT